MFDRSEIASLFLDEDYWDRMVIAYGEARRRDYRLGFNDWTGVRNPNPKPFTREASLKGARAAARALSPLSDDEVRAIRKSKKSLADLALRYGISKASASRIRNRKRRAEVPDENEGSVKESLTVAKIREFIDGE